VLCSCLIRWIKDPMQAWHGKKKTTDVENYGCLIEQMLCCLSLLWPFCGLCSLCPRSQITHRFLSWKYFQAPLLKLLSADYSDDCLCCLRV
jgi:hypothetical protein